MRIKNKRTKIALLTIIIVATVIAIISFFCNFWGLSNFRQLRKPKIEDNIVYGIEYDTDEETNLFYVNPETLIGKKKQIDIQKGYLQYFIRDMISAGEMQYLLFAGSADYLYFHHLYPFFALIAFPFS